MPAAINGKQVSTPPINPAPTDARTVKGPSKFGKFLQIAGAAIDTSGQSFNAVIRNDQLRKQREQQLADEQLDQLRQEAEAIRKQREKENDRQYEAQYDAAKIIAERAANGGIDINEARDALSKFRPDVQASIPEELLSLDKVAQEKRELKTRADEALINQRNASAASSRDLIQDRAIDNERLDRVATSTMNKNNAQAAAALDKQANTQTSEFNKIPNTSGPDIKNAKKVLKGTSFTVLDEGKERTFDFSKFDEGANGADGFADYVAAETERLLARKNNRLSAAEATEVAKNWAAQYVDIDKRTFRDGIQFNASDAIKSGGPTVVTDKDGMSWIKSGPLDTDWVRVK